MPVILQSKSTGVVAIAVDEVEELSQKSLKGLYSFKKTEPRVPATARQPGQARHDPQGSCAQCAGGQAAVR